MYSLNELDNKIVICEQNIKNQIFDEMNKSNILYNITFLSMDEFYTNLTFKITNELIYYVMKTYNVTVDIANTYLISLKDIFFINYQGNNKKILFLLELKEKLIKKQYIKQTNILKYYNNNSFIILGYNYIEKKYLLALNLLNDKEIKLNNFLNRKKLIVHEFNTVEDEINYTYEQIIKLLNNNININNIKISGVNSDYYFLLKKFSKMYNIPIDIENQKSLYSTKIGKEFLKQLKNDNYLDYLNIIKINNPIIYNKIINIINDFSFIDNLKDVYNLLLKKFKKTYINTLTKDDIKVVSIDKIDIKDDDYVFVLGLNQGSIPYIKKDEDYLSDQLKDELALSTTVDINKASKEQIMIKLSQINNLHLSYSKASTFKSLLPSSIINDYNMEVIKDHNLEYSYSNIYNQYALTDKIDMFTKYNMTSNELYSLYETYKNYEYDNYDNSFKGIDNTKLKQLLNNKVKLSYTRLDSYNSCKFKYYIDYILKLNIYEDTFYTSLGKVFHEVLSFAFNDNFDFETQFEQSKNKEFKNINSKDEFLLIKLKDELFFIIETIKEQLKDINYDQLLTEEEVNIEINEKCKIIFTGIIDKVMYKEENGTTYVALIDYKTGNIDTNINNNKYGFNLQLPVYIYLSKRSKLKEVCVTGFYYQTILQNEQKAEDEEEYMSKKQQYLKLKGYTVDMQGIVQFDKNEENSNIIAGLRKTKSGSFDSRSKILNLFQMNQLEKLVEKNIIDAGNGIFEGDFEINPKMIIKENKSCKYCKYRDLCFRKDKDIKVLNKVENLSFLEEYE